MGIRYSVANATQTNVIAVTAAAIVIRIFACTLAAATVATAAPAIAIVVHNSVRLFLPQGLP